MNLFVCGSNQLTTWDKKTIQKFLTRYASKHSIHVLCYKSIENEVLRFFLEHEELISRLHIYTFHPLENLSNAFQEMIPHLVSLGGHYSSFGYMNASLYRSDYIQYVQILLKNMDLVVCFYNGDTHTSVIPADIAKEHGIDAFICDLPGENRELAHRKFENMLRLL